MVERIVRFVVFGFVGMAGALLCTVAWVASQPKMEPLSRTTGIMVLSGIAVTGLLLGLAMATTNKPKP